MESVFISELKLISPSTACNARGKPVYLTVPPSNFRLETLGISTLLYIPVTVPANVTVPSASTPFIAVSKDAGINDSVSLIFHRLILNAKSVTISPFNELVPMSPSNVISLLLRAKDASFSVKDCLISCMFIGKFSLIAAFCKYCSVP